MSEAKQLRPRLTRLELRFHIDSLKYTPKVVADKEREHKELQSKVYRLRREIRIGNTSVWRELKEAKEELSSVGNFEVVAFNYRIVCRSLIRRFDSILNSGKKRTSWWAKHSLQQIYLEPKNLGKTQSA